jgi:cell division septation protein DedD
MTLTKQKPRRVSDNHRKRHGQHHKQGPHYIKAYWPYLPMVAVLALGILANSWFGHMNHSVLGYATDISIQSLLDSTNVQRGNNGEAGLGLNGQLDQAAQAKANDMAARDYWSHNTPDGQTPWTFMTAAGYSYQTAGENLAYGFTTTADTMTGWMNSPGHRANILNTSFTEVGFGIVNIPNYQNSGPETLVVAMYASPASAPVAAATPKPAAPAPAAQPVATPTPAPVASTTPAPEPTPTAQTTTTPSSDTLTNPSVAKTAPEPTQKRVLRLQLVSQGQTASWSMFAVSMLTFGALGFLFIRHGFAWRKVLVKGEKFVLHHPLIDVATVAVITICLVLSQTSGLIR